MVGQEQKEPNLNHLRRLRKDFADSGSACLEDGPWAFVELVLRGRVKDADQAVRED